MNASTTADAALQLPKERSGPSSEECVPLTKWEILEAYDLLAGWFTSGYCGG